MRNKNGKTKEELKREKKLNKSLIYTAKNMQEDLNIVAFQQEDNIIKTSENHYIGVFSIHGTDTFLNFNSLISLLCANLAQRFRISSFYQQVNNQLKDMHYLSLFFEETEYYFVHDMLKKLREEFFPILRKYGFLIEQISLNDILIFWNMNMTSSMASLDAKKIFTAKRYQSLFKKTKLAKIEKGIFDYQSDAGVALKIISFDPESKNFPIKALSNFKKIFFTSDVQKLSDEDIKLYQRILRSSYYPYKKQEEHKIVNASVSLVLMNETRDELSVNIEKLLSICEEKGFLLAPCFEEEMDCFYSLSSFGVMDYKNMHCIDLEQMTRFYKED